MRFDKTITEAHQWWKNGDHPADDIKMVIDDQDKVTWTEGKVVGFSPNPSPALCTLCASPMVNHGHHRNDLVHPGDWIVTKKNGNYDVVHPNPLTDVLVVEEDGNTQRLLHPEGDMENIKVVFYADCREHSRRRFNNREERDTWAETHRTKDSHIVDVYEAEA